MANNGKCAYCVKLHVGMGIVMLDNHCVIMLCYLGEYSKDPFAIASSFGYAVL